tara:strand:- start:6169 stop:6321 length:153 start_codon:yes stop_codon:yes gene_type:complete
MKYLKELWSSLTSAPMHSNTADPLWQYAVTEFRNDPLYAYQMLKRGKKVK